jgi:hypothetical protein
VAARHGRKAAFADSWVGILVYETGFAVALLLLPAAVIPWPLLSLALALGALTIWWDGDLEEEEGARPGWAEWLARRMGLWWAEARSYATERIPRLGHGRMSWLAQYGTALLAAIAVASLAGVPFTAGARGRWSFYAAWLREGNASLLIALVADTFFVAGLWLALGAILGRADGRRPRPTTVLALISLIIPIVILGIAPGVLGEGLGLGVAEASDVSVWGLGLIYILPWLLGAWLVRLTARLSGTLSRVQEVANLNWLYRAAGWVGERLASAIHWLGRVGEGEGWWGWVLIILALGVVLLLAR